MAKGTKYSQQFKEDAVRYRLDHPELPLRKASENLGVSESALKNWMKAAKEHITCFISSMMIQNGDQCIGHMQQVKI